MDWVLWFLSFMPIWVYYLLGALAFVGVMQIPLFGGLKTATAAAVFVFALGYAGDVYRAGWEGGAAKGYKIGHADGLKNWKPDPAPVKRVGKAPRYRGVAAKVQEAVKPPCVKRGRSALPGSC